MLKGENIFPLCNSELPKSTSCKSSLIPIVQPQQPSANVSSFQEIPIQVLQHSAYSVISSSRGWGLHLCIPHHTYQSTWHLSKYFTSIVLKKPFINLLVRFPIRFYASQDRASAPLLLFVIFLEFK